MKILSKSLIACTLTLSLIQAAEVNFNQIPGSYDSCCVKIKLSEEVNRDLRTIVCHGGNEPKGTILVGEKIQQAGLFFHDQKSKQYHISFVFMKPNPTLVMPKALEEYYLTSKNVMLSLVESCLRPSYDGHVNHGVAGLNGVWMLVNGYDQLGNKITKHYATPKIAQENIYQDFLYQDIGGEWRSNIVTCHYVLRIGTSPTRQCDGISGPLSHDIKDLTQQINIYHDETYWINPYKGIHDDFLGHLTVGVVKAQKGEITANSPKIPLSHLNLLVEGYKEIQSCFEWKNNSGDIKAHNEKVQKKNDDLRQKYMERCQAAFNRKYKAKVESVLAHNNNQQIAQGKIAQINQQRIWSEVYSEINTPVYKSLLPNREAINVFKDIKIEDYVMEINLCYGNKQVINIKGTKR